MRFLKTDSLAQQAIHGAASFAAQNARQQRKSVRSILISVYSSIAVLLIFISTLAFADDQTGTISDKQASAPSEKQADSEKQASDTQADAPADSPANAPINPQVIDLLPDAQSAPQSTTQSTAETTTEAKPAGTHPTPFTAKYKVTKGIMSVGSTKRTLKDEGNGYYVFESVTKPGGIAKLFTSGKVTERSYWRYQNDNLVPHEYVYINSGDQKRDVKLEFDWDNYKVTNIINGDPWTMGIEERTLDKLIYQLAIMYDLSRGKDKLQYQVADGGKMKSYDIKIEGEVRLVTELGTFNTIKIVRATDKRTTTMWCARELQYLPAKIEQKKKDDSPVTAILVELSGIPYTSKKKPTQKPAK